MVDTVGWRHQWEVSGTKRRWKCLSHANPTFPFDLKRTYDSSPLRRCGCGLNHRDLHILLVALYNSFSSSYLEWNGRRQWLEEGPPERGAPTGKRAPSWSAHKDYFKINLNFDGGIRENFSHIFYLALFVFLFFQCQLDAVRTIINHQNVMTAKPHFKEKNNYRGRTLTLKFLIKEFPDVD